MLHCKLLEDGNLALREPPGLEVLERDELSQGRILGKRNELDTKIIGEKLVEIGDVAEGGGLFGVSRELSKGFETIIGVVRDGTLGELLVAVFRDDTSVAFEVDAVEIVEELVRLGDTAPLCVSSEIDKGVRDSGESNLFVRVHFSSGVHSAFRTPQDSPRLATVAEGVSPQFTGTE